MRKLFLTIPRKYEPLFLQQSDLLEKIRFSIYRLGFRPKPGSIFYSPSIAFSLELLEAIRKVKKEKGF
jgi:hypothetical protein